MLSSRPFVGEPLSAPYDPPPMLPARLHTYLTSLRLALHAKYFAKYIFVHINKSGGVSVEHALGLPHKNHTTAAEYVEMVGKERWRRLFTFSVVRNPWDRVVSHYHFRIQTGQTGMGISPPSFEEWVKRTYSEQDPEFYNDPKFFAPQCEWLSDTEGTILVDFVCRLERIQEDFAHVCERIGIEAAVPHLNRTTRGPYQEYYDDTTREIVGRWFERDIELFGYSY
jgi:chondroitin 4-sulfotransferase 11